jgi:2-oxoglutarate/2-oxoacid ferredoxin oxidoreductase subunit beta
MTSSFMVKNATLPYCKGCGHGLVLGAFGQALESLRLLPSEVAVVTDIGCVGLADALFATPHTVHTTHGRSTAFATGLALSDSVLGQGKLKSIVMIGDGGAMIGINHLINAALLNADMTVLVHNNFLFGMTGGQNSAFSPEEFITATTPRGNAVPPLDLARVLMASRASFVARKLTSDRDLAEVIARAIAHPGFAVVEVLELCTGFATKWNPLTGAQLKQVAEKAGYELGVMRDEQRPTFGEGYKSRSEAAKPSAGQEKSPAKQFVAQMQAAQRLVMAGTAGERVQTAAGLLGQAAMLCGLHVTQKNDYPVTQGTGFSVSEVILSPEEILYTGIEVPDAVLVLSADGAKELERSGVLGNVTEETLVLADADVRLPDLPCTIQRFAFRTSTGPKNAALAAAAQWLDMTSALPIDALWTALSARYPKEAESTKSSIEKLLQTV